MTSMTRASATDVLAEILGEAGLEVDGLRIVDRRASRLGGTFPAEIVTCRLADGEELRLFCKLSGATARDDHGHRRGVHYEAQVYRALLATLDLPTAVYYGARIGGGRAMIVLGFVEDGEPVAKSLDAMAMPNAAEWAGRVAASTARSAARRELGFMTRYDAAFYRGWVERAASFSTGLEQRFRWLPPLCARADDFISILRAAPQTVVHGEYYPANILAAGGRVYPVDWESAAFAPGEIDLAALTERWPDGVVAACEAAYVAARWPTGPPAGFRDVLAAARLYLQFRWLGEHRDWTHDPASRWRFELARSLGEELGLL